ncbi:exocyst complex component EXO70B1-like [Salvia divinorum]|uniref:Exocyst subunit Exo70 family protein n=1 Tax=Salvia divinorum TaxID=28513 RepID=A0ABD1HA21_SALDI
MDPEKDKPESLDDAKPEKNDAAGDEAKAEEAENNNAETKATDEETPAETEKEEGAETDIEVESEAKEVGGDEDPAPTPSALNIDKLSQEVDNYLSTLSALKQDGDESSIPQDVPNFVKQFSLMVEARIADYDSGKTAVKWSSLSEEESASFLEAITRLSSLSTALLAFSAHRNFARSINRIGAVLERAISYVEEEFKDLLDEYRFQDPNPNVTNADESAKPEEDESEENAPPPPEDPPKEDNHFPGYEDEVLSNLIRLSKMMIAIDYETECCEAYTVARRTALEESLHKLGFEKHSIDDVQKMQWEPLEREIASWISIFKQCTTLLGSERNLARAVFPDRPTTSDRVLCDLAQGLSATLLNFAVAVALTKSASEKLFKFLDTYEALRDVLPTLDGLFPEQESWLQELRAEGGFIKVRLGEAIVSIFLELETSIRTDAGKTPVPGGAIHPLTRYIMNYLNYACEYKESIAHIFKEHHRNDGAESSGSGSGSPFHGQVTKMMELLDENMEAKSKLYKDHALGAIFLMNNGRYVLQKVRGSNEISSLTGDAWCRKKSTDLRQYHKVYQRETWGKLLSYLHPDGLTAHGKVVKPVLKERFKNFNAMFDEIKRTQTNWVVCDEQLQSELRVSISNMVVPAYRSFLGRYGQVFTPGRQTEKYVKYQGEEVENSIDELFDGKK